MLLTLISCYKFKKVYTKLSLISILEIVYVFIEILFKMVLFKGGVLIYNEHCNYANYQKSIMAAFMVQAASL